MPKSLHLPLNEFPKQIILWGGGDQARVIIPILRAKNANIVACFDDTKKSPSPDPDIPLFYGKQAFKKWIAGKKLKDIGFVIAIGNPYGKTRVELHEYLCTQGLLPVSFSDSTAVIDQSATIGPGAQIMRQTLINSHAIIGTQCIINSQAIVEHDDILGNGVEIAPGSKLCGRVTVGDYAWICAGSVVIPRVRIGNGALVAAGSVVTKNVLPNSSVGGCPARTIKTAIRNVI